MKKKSDTPPGSRFTLLESFLLPAGSVTALETGRKNGLLMYGYFQDNRTVSYLVIKGKVNDDIVAYCSEYSPEIYSVLEQCMEKGSLLLDFDHNEAYTPSGKDTRPLTLALLDALGTVAQFPKRTIDASSGIVSVILCGGKGTRMQSKDLHKVCFPIAGRPAINRLIDQLESVGIHEHIVVVGEKGRQVVNEVSEIRDNVAYVFQINQNGTGNAAKQAAHLLKARSFKGNVLVIYGDKVVETSALERLLGNFRESGADLAVMTAEKTFWPDSGRVVFDRKGRPIDIVEKRDIQKMILARRLHTLKREKPKTSPRMLLREILDVIPSLAKAHKMFPGLIEVLEKNTALSFGELNTLVPERDTFYMVDTETGEEAISGEALENTTPAINAAVYLYSADAFIDSLFRIRSDNAQKEEYITDTVRILARDTAQSRKIIPVPVRGQYEVMSFNNPEELLKIEEYYSRKESQPSFENSCFGRIDIKHLNKALRPVDEWLRIFEDLNPEVKAGLAGVYGGDEDVLEERREAYHQALLKYLRVFGKNKPVIIARSPGRVNLMGRHVEHRGGYTNYMTINREVILVAGVREDDVITIHNVDAQNFRPRSFSVGEELSRLPWDDWLNMINSETVSSMIRSSRGDWANYFKAAALRLQEKLKGRLLFGFDGVLSGQIPLAAGLSSSSAVVVSAAEALTFINSLSFVPKEFVDLCGEGEWFVGTRGGSGDHAAMKFGERGNILHMGFHEVRIEDVIPFPEGVSLVILQSHQYAKKSGGAMQIFNEKVATYEIAYEIVRLRFPKFRERLAYFRDIDAGHLCLEPHEIYDILLAIPERVSRKELLGILDNEGKNRMGKVFSTHEEPGGGYEARSVALFGMAEIARAREFARIIKQGDIERAAHLMNISHDGDRVTRLNEKGERVRYDNSAPDSLMRSLRDRLKAGDPGAALHLQPGGYGCSTPLIDEMVDTALTIDGVLGVQLSGAGLGGCIMAFVKNGAVNDFRMKIETLFYAKHGLPQQVLICTPISGSGIFSA
ncbi:NTP transferase domain-containing protein [bacterium]|nr:NTP transferase domain-containing protein [bacterium]